MTQLGATLPTMASFGGIRSSLSSAYMTHERPSCFRLLRHVMPCAFVFALDSVGKSMDAKIAMMAMTTSSSMRVNARLESFGRHDTFLADLAQDRHALFAGLKFVSSRF